MEKFSYSKLDLFDQCPYKYKLKYIDGNFSAESTLVLELGSLAHKGKEIWAEYLLKGEKPDYEYIDYIFQNGIEVREILIINDIEVENKVVEDINGIKDLKSKYFDSYYEKCNKTGMSYDEKIKIYKKNLVGEKLDNGWKVLAVEEHFNFVYKDRCILNGFIDRVDINENGDLRVVDYKTSKEIYKDEKLATPLQMFMYALACEYLYKKQPIEYMYDFIFLGQNQKACTKGYYNRGLKKLDKLLDKIDECKEKNEYLPKATPLCFWCDYAGHTPLADKKLNGLCSYYCLWTPNNKVFNVNQKYGDFANKTEISTNKPERKNKELIW